MLISIENMGASFAGEIRWEYKTIGRNCFQCCDKFSLAVLLDSRILFAPAGNNTSPWRNSHHKTLFIDIRDCAGCKSSAANDFAELSEVFVDDARIAGIHALTVDTTSKFCRKHGMTIQKACDPILSDVVFLRWVLALHSRSNLHLPMALIFSEMLN